MRNKEDDKRTRGEKIQDTTRDIFVFLVILFIFVIPTIYIGVRTFQPMTLPGYSDRTFNNFIQDEFKNHLREDAQLVAFLKILITPYSSGIDVIVRIFPKLDQRIESKKSSIILSDVPNVWWASIQEECVSIFETIKSLYPDDYRE